VKLLYVINALCGPVHKLLTKKQTINLTCHQNYTSYYGMDENF